MAIGFNGACIILVQVAAIDADRGGNLEMAADLQNTL
jgi:hypothetical protein